MRRAFGVLALLFALVALLAILRSPAPKAEAAGAFTSSEQCKSCHEREYAEWSVSWHALAWTDPEVRALSNDFANADCIDCHAPQPVLETGVAQRVLPRSSRRGEGVDCISCHALPAGHSSGGRVAGTRNMPEAPCAPIALRDLGTPAFCASCHDQHDTTKQWRATKYAADGIGCVDCHMRKRADGSPGRDHSMLGGHDIELVKQAVAFRGRAQDGRWQVEVENVGAGHHFPTEERARAADVFWRPLDGTRQPWKQVYRFRSPYHHEGLPDTLLPAHQTREIPIVDASASAPIEVTLYYSLKPYWADPEHPDPEREARLVKRLELRPADLTALAAPPVEARAPAPDSAVLEGLRAQIAERAHLQGKLRALALADIVAEPGAAITAAEALLSDGRVSDEAKRSALEVLGGIGTLASARALARRVEIATSHAPWIRAMAAFELRRLSIDAVVPDLCAQLKYETDGETVIWIAAVLAKHRNYSGLDGLRVLALQALTPDVQDRARGMLEEIASEAGFPDADALYAAWNSDDPERRVPRAEPSPELRGAIRRRVSELAVFDLKLVDDARFVLSRSPWWVVDVLVEALHEEAPQLRTCAAQSLERMGARASSACPALVQALEEPRMAPAAATALAAIGCRDALEPLVRCTQAGRDPELRHAAARALGVLGSQPALDALTRLLAGADTPDLRQTAAESLVGLGQGARGAPLLVECLTRPGADHDTAEQALERWLELEGNTQRLEAWRALAGDPATTPTVAQAAERRKARAALLLSGK